MLVFDLAAPVGGGGRIELGSEVLELLVTSSCESEVLT